MPLSKTSRVAWVACLTLLAIGCAEGEIVPMPRELQGTWWTTARDYQDRYVKISALRVRFGTGGGMSTVHDVIEVRKLSLYRDDYRISYRVGSDRENWLSIRYFPAQRVLRLINQPQLEWTQEPPVQG